MTNEAIIRQLREKDEYARQEGLRVLCMDFRMMLHKLRIIRFSDNMFPSIEFSRKHSPLYKKRVK